VVITKKDSESSDNEIRDNEEDAGQKRSKVKL
jgi:hypothetical protein